MSIQSMIKAAVKPVVPEIARGEYTGEGEVFCVWDASEMPGGFGNNLPGFIHYLVQLHLILPFEAEPQEWINRVRAAIQSEDLFSAPVVEPVEADEQDSIREFAFEFEAIIREAV